MTNPPQKNRGYLFPNKKTNPAQPDFRGKLTVDGKELLVSGWNKEKDTPEGKVMMISIEATPASDVPVRQGGTQADGSSPPASPPAGGKASPASSDPDGAVFGDIFSQPLD